MSPPPPDRKVTESKYDSIPSTAPPAIPYFPNFVLPDFAHQSPSPDLPAIMPGPSQGVKAKKSMRVYISGFTDKHPIETGVAYFYRGHYLYGAIGNPTTPVTFASKKEIMVVSTTTDTAPEYNQRAPGLQAEHTIAALHKSMVHEWEARPKEPVALPLEDVESQRADSEAAQGKAFSAEQLILNSLQLVSAPDLVSDFSHGSTNVFTATAQAGQRDTNAPPDTSFAGAGYPPTMRGPDIDRYYNNRALYLAASAPGSRHVTPPYSNTPCASRVHSPSGSREYRGLRPVASTTRVSSLLAQGNLDQSIASLQLSSAGMLRHDIPYNH